MQLCFMCWTYFRILEKRSRCSCLSTINEIRQSRLKCPSDMLDIADSFVEISSSVDHKFVPNNGNVTDGMEIVETPKTKCHEKMKPVMFELTVLFGPKVSQMDRSFIGISRSVTRKMRRDFQRNSIK